MPNYYIDKYYRYANRFNYLDRVFRSSDKDNFRGKDEFAGSGSVGSHPNGDNACKPYFKNSRNKRKIKKSSQRRNRS